jgi:GGDEF domain-containing protein
VAIPLRVNREVLGTFYLDNTEEQLLRRIAQILSHTVDRMAMVMNSYHQYLSLMKQIYSDKLTKIANRAAFDERKIQLDLLNVQKSIAFIDVDNFKLINDTHGHRA